MPKPDLQTLPPHLHDEINAVEQDDVKEAFAKRFDVISFLKNIPDEKWMHSYAEGKWTIKAVVQHLIDAERIFCNRALIVARKDSNQPLLSFEEEDYAAHANADKRTKEDLMSEFEAVQHSSRKLFESFDEEQLNNKGQVSNYRIDSNALGFVVLGHTLHHVDIINERYL
ncbi:MAG: DinB family protein [Chitinophagaceae bacterium]